MEILKIVLDIFTSIGLIIYFFNEHKKGKCLEKEQAKMDEYINEMFIIKKNND